nr:transposase [Micromonospora purpureochromogenes]
MAAPKKYPDELCERAVRLYRESDPKPVIRQLARQLGVHHEALRNWIRQDEADRGQRDDRPTTSELEELRRLRRENAELKRANEILKAASAFRLGTRPDPATVVTLVDELRDRFGVEPVLRVLNVAVSTYYGWLAQTANPSARRRDDAETGRRDRRDPRRLRRHLRQSASARHAAPAGPAGGPQAGSAVDA